MSDVTDTPKATTATEPPPGVHPGAPVPAAGMDTGAQLADAQSADAQHPHVQHRDLLLEADATSASRQSHAQDDLLVGTKMWRLAFTLGWLDIRLRYRGSVLGPFWLTLSTAVMVGALGVLYSTLFKIDQRSYLPYLTLSLVLWGYLAAVVGDACVGFTQAENIIQALRIPFTLFATRVGVRNVLILAHNIVVVIGVFAIFEIWPGVDALLSLPGFLLWLVDSFAATLLLGTLCARFRDIPPIVGSVMQIAFFISPIIWKPELVTNGWWLPLNPFYSLLEIVRAPLLGEMPSGIVYVSAIVYSVLFCAVSWLTFTRLRSRLAFWV